MKKNTILSISINFCNLLIYSSDGKKIIQQPLLQCHIDPIENIHADLGQVIIINIMVSTKTNTEIFKQQIIILK